jgi:hypothetical protein
LNNLAALRHNDVRAQPNEPKRNMTLAKSGIEKRQRLFDLYSKHFALGDPERREMFVCPLCCTGFTREDCAGKNPRLSLAHFISQKLGGKDSDCTLTCTDCNNGVGTNLEAALVERWKADDFAAGIGTMRAGLSGAFGEISVEYELSPQRRSMSFYGLPERSNPKHSAALHQYLTENSKDTAGEVQFSVTPAYRHQPQLVTAALYHSAYLVMFAYFGYDFVFHPHFTPLRERVAKPDDQNWRSPMFVDDEVARSFPIQQRTAVVFLGKPIAILVVLRLQHKDRRGSKDGRERVVAIALPGLDCPELPTGRQNNLKGGIVPYCPERLLRRGSYLHAAWRQITGMRR